MLKKYLPMDEMETTLLKKLSSGECCQGEYSTKEATSSRIDRSFQANESIRSDQNNKDVFLSHSGKQKNFVRQLYTDLTSQGLSCFFDRDRDSLPVGENFPSRIFEATETCKVAVLVLSKDFLESKWPMQELAAFVKARDTTHTNPKLKILPLFFHISPDALKDIKADNEKWIQLEMCEGTQEKWCQALKAIRPINGINFRDGEDEVELREKVVKEIWRILPPSKRYHTPNIQGAERMCQEVTSLFNTVGPNRKGVFIAGLYGIVGYGKTSLGKAFCNLKLTEFEGKVCHLEFSRGEKDDSFKRKTIALRYLTHCPQSRLEEDQAEVELHKRLKGQRVLLILDNITEESIEEVRDYIEADFSKNSYILLSARSIDLLVNHFKIDRQSCMRVPSLEEDEAVAILLKITFLEVSMLGAEDKKCALKCANRCLFSCDTVRRDRTFHPLALKAFGRHLFSKYGWNLSKWVADMDGSVDRSGYGLDDVLAVVHGAFNDMHSKYRTIFMLLNIYMLPNMSSHKVIEWLAIICNEEMSFINTAIEELCKKAFIEEFEPEIRIHDLYVVFAQSTAKEMGKWLWQKGDLSNTRGLISQDHAGFELARLEQCMHRKLNPRYFKNLVLLQLVGVHNMNKLDFRQMDSLRSITLQNCEDLAELEGTENLVHLAWLQISKVNRMFKLPKLSGLEELQHLEIDIAGSQVVNQLGDLTPCSYLREINVRCPSLPEFPRLNGLAHLETVEFSMCGEVKEPLDCTDCVMLQSIVLSSCCKMAASPVLTGCTKLYKIVLSDCDAVTTCPDIDVAGDEPSALKTLELSISSEAASAPRCLESCDRLENLHLWNMGELKELPSFNRLSNLTVLKIGKCGIRQSPDLTCCLKLENVCFLTCRNLESFPNFSLLRELKILNLYNCRRVQDPPDISDCHELQVLHLVCNDNMKGLPKMHECAQLDEIKVSWHCEDELTYEGIDPDSSEVDDNFQCCLEHFKGQIPVQNFNDACVPIELRKWLEMQEKRWMHARTMLVQKYFRGAKLYCSVMASHELYESSNCYKKNYITLRLEGSKVIAFPTPDKASIDRNWLNKVREYQARTSVKQGKILIPALNCKEIASLPPVRVNKDRGWLNKVQEYFAFAGKKDIARASATSEWENVEGGSQRLTMCSVPPMQGEERTCKKVAKLVNFVRPNAKGIRIAGLYGIPGLGKTTLGKAFCNLNMRTYNGKVFHVEFNGGNASDGQKLALQYLTHSPKSQVEWVKDEDDVRYYFCTKVEGQKVLLVLDNITEDSIDKVRDYLGADVGKKSCILLIARSADVLVKNFNINYESCMRIPRIREDEALAILLESTSVEVSALEAEGRSLALKCAKSCFINVDESLERRFHPLALKALGRLCFTKYGSCLSKWVAEIEGFLDRHLRSLDVVFNVLGMAFNDMDLKSCSIFMLLTVLIPPKLCSDEVIKWLAENCKGEVEDLYKNGFIEEIEPQIRVHELMQEFAKELEGRMWKVKLPFPPRYCVTAMQGDAHIFQSDRDPPLSPRFRVPAMQGAARMCQEVADFFNTVHLNEKGIRIAGLYGMSGQGKTTLGKALCNLNSEYYDGRLCHLEFCGDNKLERQKLALQYLTDCPQSELESVTSEEEAQAEFYKWVKGKRVLLILDNIETEESIGEVRNYLEADVGEESCILLIARSVDVLLKNFNINSKSCMCMPSITEEEAVAILLEKASLEKPALSLFCQSAFGIPPIPSDTHLDNELTEQVQEECKGLPLAVQEIVISRRCDQERAKNMISEEETLGDYHKDGILNRLKTSINVLDDDEKQCFLDLAAFPLRKSIPANALLDIWVYVRGMNRDKAVVLSLKFAARHLLHLTRNPLSPTIGDDCMTSYTFSQDDLQRTLALFLEEHDNKTHFRRMYMLQKQSYNFHTMWQADRYQSSRAQIVSIHTGAMTYTQWPEMDFPEAEALILYFTASEYRIPPFLSKMKKLKILIIQNDFKVPANLTGLDNFQPLTQLNQLTTLHLEGLIIPPQLLHCQAPDSLKKIYIKPN